MPPRRGQNLRDQVVLVEDLLYMGVYVETAQFEEKLSICGVWEENAAMSIKSQMFTI